MFYRNSVIAYVRYRENGEIDPVRITETGVGQYDALTGMDATDFFRISGGRVREMPRGGFAVGDLKYGSYLVYPKVRNLDRRSQLVLRAKVADPRGARIEVRRDDASGAIMGSAVARPDAAGAEQLIHVPLHKLREKEDLCLVFHGGDAESIELSRISFV